MYVSDSSSLVSLHNVYGWTISTKQLVFFLFSLLVVSYIGMQLLYSLSLSLLVSLFSSLPLSSLFPRQKQLKQQF